MGTQQLLAVGGANIDPVVMHQIIVLPGRPGHYHHPGIVCLHFPADLAGKGGGGIVLCPVIGIAEQMGAVLLGRGQLPGLLVGAAVGEIHPGDAQVSVDIHLYQVPGGYFVGIIGYLARRV